jgi:hypothetical protein
MARPTKSPSRETGYAETVRALIERDGMVCFLCGHKHATVHTMQADLLNHEHAFELDNLVATCKPCAKRRNGKPVAAYWRERLSAAAAEQAHVKMMGGNSDVIKNLKTVFSYAPRITPDVPHAVVGTGSMIPKPPAPAPKPRPLTAVELEEFQNRPCKLQAIIDGWNDEEEGED